MGSISWIMYVYKHTNTHNKCGQMYTYCQLMHGVKTFGLFFVEYIYVFKSSSKIFLLTVPKRYFFCGSFVLFKSCVCLGFASVHGCLVVTCWESADLLALFVMFNCTFVTFPCGILGQVWYLIVSISDLCPLPYFAREYFRDRLQIRKTPRNNPGYGTLNMSVLKIWYSWANATNKRLYEHIKRD